MTRWSLVGGGVGLVLAFFGLLAWAEDMFQLLRHFLFSCCRLFRGCFRRIRMFP